MVKQQPSFLPERSSNFFPPFFIGTSSPCYLAMVNFLFLPCVDPPPFFLARRVLSLGIFRVFGGSSWILPPLVAFFLPDFLLVLDGALFLPEEDFSFRDRCRVHSEGIPPFGNAFLSSFFFPLPISPRLLSEYLGSSLFFPPARPMQTPAKPSWFLFERHFYIPFLGQYWGTWCPITLFLDLFF